jgi:hypothetical protein
VYSHPTLDIYSKQINYLDSSKGNSVCPEVIFEKRTGWLQLESALHGIFTQLDHAVDMKEKALLIQESLYFKGA